MPKYHVFKLSESGEFIVVETGGYNREESENRLMQHGWQGESYYCAKAENPEQAIAQTKASSWKYRSPEESARRLDELRTKALDAKSAALEFCVGPKIRSDFVRAFLDERSAHSDVSLEVAEATNKLIAQETEILEAVVENYLADIERNELSDS